MLAMISPFVPETWALGPRSPEDVARAFGFKALVESNSAPMQDFRSRVEGERAYLLRYASLQLRDAHAAEDAVQETLVAALAGEKSFGGRSNLRTWLTGILKHKIIDTIRKGARETPIESDEALEALEALFNETDHWK